MNTAFFKDLHFRSCSIFCSAYNGTCVTHTTSCRSCLTSDEPNNRLFISGSLDPACGLCFQSTTNLTDHNDSFSFRIVHEQFNSFTGSGSDNWISADTDSRSNAKACFHNLVSCFISQG